jgi:hypothetical protein
VKTKIQLVISILIFIGFIAVIEHYFTWSKILSPWYKLDRSDLLVTVLLIFTSYWARTMRIYYYFINEMRHSLSECMKLVLHHNMLNNLLPMRTGEISFPVLMSRYFNIPASRSIPTLLWFRILDLHTLLGITIIALAGFFYNYIVAFLLFAVWMTAPVIFFKTNKSLIKKLGPQTNNRFQALLLTGLTSLPQNSRDFFHVWGWTWLNWSIKMSVSAWIILLFLDTSINIAYIGAITGDLTSVLPIHGIAGFGSYEAGVLAGFLPFDTYNTIENKADALQAAVSLHLIILGSSLIGGAVAFLIPGKSRNNAS